MRPAVAGEDDAPRSVWRRQRCAGARGGGAGNKADVKFTAQNGRTANSKPVLTNSCKKKHAKAKGHKRIVAWLPGFSF